jgi:hypothetical protein
MVMKVAACWKVVNKISKLGSSVKIGMISVGGSLTPILTTREERQVGFFCPGKVLGK